MYQYSPEDKRRQQMKRSGRAAATSKEKRNIIIIASCILAIILIAGTVALVMHFKGNGNADEPQFETVSQTEAPAETEPQTEAPTQTAETTTEASGDVSITDYSATMYSTTVTLNVRSAPSTNSQILGQLGQDAPITVTGKCSNGWFRIDFNGQTGYCSDKYLSGSQNQSDNPYYIKVNRTQNIVIIYTKDSNGGYTVPYKAMVCSVGMNNATPTGTYNTTDKYTWRLLSGNVYGQYATRITGHYLFHSVPYVTQNKADLEYDEFNKLGEAASLGCIRLSVEDAKWIYDNCPKGTTVTIYDSNEPEPLAKPTPIRIDTNDSRRVWDPTDPDPSNPWKQ